MEIYCASNTQSIIFSHTKPRRVRITSVPLSSISFVIDCVLFNAHCFRSNESHLLNELENFPRNGVKVSLRSVFSLLFDSQQWNGLFMLSLDREIHSDWHYPIFISHFFEKWLIYSIMLVRFNVIRFDV